MQKFGMGRLAALNLNRVSPTGSESFPKWMRLLASSMKDYSTRKRSSRLVVAQQSARRRGKSQRKGELRISSRCDVPR